MGLFGIKDGLKIFGGITAQVRTGDFDPSVSGLAAEQGSLFLRQNGVSYKKTGPNDTDWSSYGEIEAAGLLWQNKASNFTGADGYGYICDSAGGAFVATLPASPQLGDRVGFVSTGSAETNNVTISGNGSNINGASDDLVIDLNYAYFHLLFADGTTGWVLSNTDESGNVNDLRAFVGNDDNADPAVTEYTEENYITNGDDLETAVDLLDQKIKDIENLASTGVNWRAAIQAITADDPTTVTTQFSDDDIPLWDSSKWTVGDKVLSTFSDSMNNQFGKIFEWDGTAWVDSGEALGSNDAVAVSYDLLDTPGTQEDGAAYMMNSAQDAIIKIADFDLETAASIAISDGYTPAAGNPTSVDTVEGILQKLDANQDGLRSVVGGVGQGDSDLGNAAGNYIAANTDVLSALQSLDSALNSADSVENTTNVTSGGTDVTVDQVVQASTLGAKWFVMVYDSSGNRYAAEIYGMHDGSTNADMTEYAILELGSGLDVEFNLSADGTNMVLAATNNGGTAIDVKIERVTIDQ